MRDDEYAKMALPCEEIGRALACADDSAQATVINSMAKELSLVCRDENLSGMQVLYIAKSLNRFGTLLVRSLAEYLDRMQDPRP